MVKSKFWTWLFALLIGLYTTFVMQCCWNWFIIPIFNLPFISFWEFYGLTILINLFRDQNNSTDNFQFKMIITFLEACIPEHKKKELDKLLKEDNLWYEAVEMISGKLISNTFTFALAWGVSTFLI